MPRRVPHRLRIPPHIVIRVHPLQIALHCIRRQEAAHHWVIVPSVVVVQPGGISILPRKTLVGSHSPLAVTAIAVGTVDLIALDGGTACHGVEGRQDASEGVGQEELCGGAFGDEFIENGF